SCAVGDMPGPDLTSAGCERVRDQLRHATEELGAHAGMKAIAIRAAQSEKPEGAALVHQRHERHRADAARIRAEQQLALRVPRLAAAGLAAREQRFEGLEPGILGT